MIKNIKNQPLYIFFAVVVLMVMYGTFFMVEQTEQAIIIQFGEPKKVIQTAGLKLKIPLIQNVVFYDKKLLELDPPVEEVILSDQKRLKVDSFTRFRITDPLLFYQTVATEAMARARLGDIVNSSLREVLGNVTLSKLLSSERIAIMSNISSRVAVHATGMGVEVAKVRIRRADLPEEISQAINARMRSEREREAKEFRAQGQEMAQQIKSMAERDRTIIIATAEKDSQIIKGEGDNKATTIWAEAAEKDKEFYAFYRSLEAYRKSIDENKTSMVLNPDSEFFKFFGEIPKSR